LLQSPQTRVWLTNQTPDQLQNADRFVRILYNHNPQSVISVADVPSVGNASHLYVAHANSHLSAHRFQVLACFQNNELITNEEVITRALFPINDGICNQPALNTNNAAAIQLTPMSRCYVKALCDTAGIKIDAKFYFNAKTA